MTTWPPSGGTRPFSISKPTSCSRTPRAHVLERPLADEVVLVDFAIHGMFASRTFDSGVGVLPDEDVHLLEAQDALRLEAEGPMPRSAPRSRIVSQTYSP